MQQYDTVAISGMGGIGKTELAVKYARTHLEQKTYPGGVVWLKAREDVALQIVLFARSLLMPELPNDFELAEKVKIYWRDWQKEKTLVILDDVQDYGAIKSLLPVDPRFKILLTTRLTLQRPVKDFEIEVLSEETAIALLRAIATQDREDKDLRFLQEIGGLEKQLCQWLGYLPLGIELVGRYLARRQDTSLEDLWQRLQDKKLDAKALKDATPEMSASLGVAAAFELSWQELNKDTQQLAALLSLFALAEIPWMLVEACLPDVDSEALGDVRDESLLNLHLMERSRQDTYQLHQLLREFFAAKRELMADAAVMEQAFRAAMLEEVQRSTRTPKRSLLAETTVLIPHMQAVLQISETSKQEADVAIDLGGLAHLYHAQGRYAEAEPLLRRALSISEQQLSADHPNVGTIFSNLGVLYSHQGRYAEAEPLVLKALAIREQQLDADDPDVAFSLNSLAILYSDRGRYAEAEPLFRRALKIREQQLGANHPDVATSLSSLANLYSDQGRYAEAERLYLKALSIGEQQLGSNHFDVAVWLNNLAGLYKDQGRYAEAERFYLRARNIMECQLGADHPNMATSLNNLANLYSDQGRYEEAERLYLEALTIGEQQLGPDHHGVAMSLSNLAGLYQRQGRYAEAEQFCLRAYNIMERQLGANHPHVATILNTLANLYRDQGRNAEAERLYLKALKISEQLGAELPAVAVWLNNLAGLYKDQGRYAEAESPYIRALNIFFNRLGTNHPDTRRAQNGLAALYDAIAADFKLQGRYDQAAAYLEKAITLRSQLLS